MVVKGDFEPNTVHAFIGLRKSLRKDFLHGGIFVFEEYDLQKLVLQTEFLNMLNYLAYNPCYGTILPNQ